MTKIHEETSSPSGCLNAVVDGVVVTVLCMAEVVKCVLVGIKDFFLWVVSNLFEAIGTLWNETVKVTVAIAEFLVEVVTGIYDFVAAILGSAAGMVCAGSSEVRTIIQNSPSVL